MISFEPYKPIKTKRTFEEISNRIKEFVFKGVLKPGQKLPSEIELAKKFQVGRQSVREALRLLELSGFISIRTGVKGGPIIEDTMLSKMAGMFIDTFKFNRIPITDLTVARQEIEKLILKMVFENADSSDIRDLQKNIEKAKAKQLMGMAAFEENIGFHRLLAKASKNHVFSMVIEPILAIESDFRSKFKIIDIDKSIKFTNYHQEILMAIIDSDYRRAMKILDVLVIETHNMFKGNSTEAEKENIAQTTILNLIKK